MVNLLWQVRAFVYNHFADTTHPPSADETAHHFNIGVEEASVLYKELHNRHAFFLEPETLTIRMANPFSGIPTDFKVHANGKTYYANCAWDMLGIPAALHSDAIIEAICTESNETVKLEVKNGNIYALGGVPAADDGGLSSLCSVTTIVYIMADTSSYVTTISSITGCCAIPICTLTFSTFSSTKIN